MIHIIYSTNKPEQPPLIKHKIGLFPFLLSGTAPHPLNNETISFKFRATVNAR